MGNITNDTIRNHIYEELLQCGTKNNGEDVNCYELYTRKLNLMKDVEIGYPVYISVLEIAYLDAYKILNNKMRLNMITDDEVKLFNTLEVIGSVEELEEIVDSNNDLLQQLLPYATEFTDMNYLKKIMTMCSLNYNQRNIIEMEFPLFENDIEEYYENVTVRSIGDYCKQTILDAESTEKLDELGFIENKLLYELEGLLNYLVGNDIDLYIYLISGIIDLDYKWNKYLTDKGFVVEDDPSAQMRIEIYEQNNVNEIISDECLVNFEYVQELLNSFLEIKCYNMNMNDKQINDHVINEYISKIKKKKKKSKNKKG